MKKTTLKAYLRSRKMLLIAVPLAVGVLAWVDWIAGLVVLAMAIAFIYSNWQSARACCACNLEVPYGSRYCLGCGTKFSEES